MKSKVWQEGRMTQAEYKALLEAGWVDVGIAGVDSASLWIGDPSYIIHKAPKDVGKDLRDFFEREHQRQSAFPEGVAQWKHDIGHDGLGVSVATGVGDGVYTVLVKYGEAGRGFGVRIQEVRVIFFTDD
jgi:hypothetical protein